MHLQHDIDDGVIMLQDQPQAFIKHAGLVALRRRTEFILEPELIEKRLKPGVIMFAEAVMGAERVRHNGQRLVKVGGEQVVVRHIVRHLAKPVHIIGKGDQPGRDIRQDGKGMAHHGRARHLAEGADMRQAGRAITGLEQHIAFFGRRFRIAIHKLFCLDKSPGVAR